VARIFSLIYMTTIERMRAKALYLERSIRPLMDCMEG
jgi:hypothetical protein